MKRSPSSWQNVLTKLGFKRTSRARKAGDRRLGGYSRALHTEQLEDRRLLAVLHVNTYLDTQLGDLDNDLSLREAIQVVNQRNFSGLIATEWARIVQTASGPLGTNDQIVFDGVTQPIQLLDLPGTTSGEIEIYQSVKINLRADPGTPSPLIEVRAYDATPGSTPVDGLSNDGDGGRIFYVHEIPQTVGDLQVSLQDMTLTGGDVDVGQFGGGAIELVNGSLTILDCTIDHNSANGDGRDGGAIWARLREIDALEIINTTLSNNYAVGGSGGALFIDSVGAGRVSVLNSEVTDNRAFERGGGIAVGGLVYASSCPVEIQASIISGNFAGFASNVPGFSGFDGAGTNGNFESGGGIYLYTTADATVKQCYLTGNIASGSGGGLAVNSPSDDAAAIIRDSTFYGNRAAALEGGAIGGGGIYLGGQADDVIANCTVSGNVALAGGGVQLRGTPRLLHSTITGNTAQVFGDPKQSGGGGLFFVVGLYPVIYSVPTIEHCIIAGNTHVHVDDGYLPEAGFDNPDPRNYSPNIGAAVKINPFLWPGDFDRYYYSGVTPSTPITSVTMNYTIVDDLSGPLLLGALVVPAGVGQHFGDDPLLGPLTDNGGFELPDGSTIPTHAISSGSPAVNAGLYTTGQTVPIGNGEILEYDERGDSYARISDGRIDIGAFELQPPPDTTPPTVADVRIGGTSWTGRAPVSYRDNNLVGSGIQLTPIAAIGVDFVDIVFSEPVTEVTADDLVILRSTGSEVYADSVTFNPDSDPTTYDYRFALDLSSLPQAWLETDKYALVLNSDGSIQDGSGNVLDGDWVNPIDPLAETSDTFETGGDGTAGGAFKFNFSVFPGDYAGNYVESLSSYTQDAADYTVWRDSLGEVGPNLAADGDGNGVIEDPADWQVWKSHFGNKIEVPWPADFVADGFVNLTDYGVLKSTYGSTTELTADADGSGAIGVGDYLIWAEFAGQKNPWIYELPEPSWSWTAPTYLPDQAPQVTNVALSGSTSAHPEFEFDGVVGSGEQLRSVPVGGIDTIRITFSEEVFVESGNLTIVGMEGQTIPDISQLTYDVETHSATWVFDDTLDIGQYLIRLSDEVHDLDNDALDGEFTNPWSVAEAAGYASTFPSGDGTAGGEFRFRFTNLTADYNGNNVVESTDDDVWFAHLGWTA